MQSYWSKTLSRRLSRRRALVAAGGSAAAAAFLAACGGGGEESGGDSSGLVTKAVDTSNQAKRGGTIKLEHFQDVQGLDPGFANLPNEAVRAYVYSHLLQYEPGYLGPIENKPVGDIGESFEFTPDGLTMTVKIRQGVKWHNKPPINGRAMDIDDVLFSYNRLAEKGVPRGDVVNAANPNAPVLSFTATDRNTITIKLKEPTSYITAIFAYQTGLMPILPKETDGAFDVRGDQIGTGPWVLEKYTPSISFVYKRNPDYYNKSLPYADAVELPIVSEYAARLSQFKTGNIYNLTGQSRVRGEDILATKRDAPEILIYQDDVAATGMHTAFGWLPEGRSPWLDERVRQAYSMSLDRDGWIDAVYNVSRFESEGLPLETKWNTCLGVTFAPYWIDPKDSKFGPNAKYFEHNVTESKKLLSAAGHANGLDFVSTFPEGTSYGAGFPRELEIVGGMTQEAGFRPQASPINYTAEFIPKYREGRGQHDGVAYKIGPGFATDGVARLVYDLYSKAGTNFYGFSASGRNDLSGDPAIESLIQRAKGELDAEKRYAIAHDVQREMAKKQWMVMWPGGASGFLMSWPAVQNFQVYRAGNLAPASRWWLDPTKAPLKA